MYEPPCRCPCMGKTEGGGYPIRIFTQARPKKSGRSGFFQMKMAAVRGRLRLGKIETESRERKVKYGG